MKPPPESERGPFCLAGDKGRSKNAQVIYNVPKKILKAKSDYSFLNFLHTY